MRDSSPMMTCTKRPPESNMNVPLGLLPQRSKVVPSPRVLTDEIKRQVPTNRAAMLDAADSDRAEYGAIAALPSSTMNPRRFIAVPAVFDFFAVYHNTARLWKIPEPALAARVRRRFLHCGRPRA